MASRLQIIADDLADRLGRAVMINDKHWRLEGYSALGDEVDEVRLHSILQRHAPDGVKSWASELGLAKAREPVRTPANPGLGVEPRVVFPMRYNDILVGFVVIMDRDLSPDDLRVATLAVEEAAVAKYQDQLVEGLARGRERELLRQLVAAEDADLRQQAAASLHDEGLLLPSASMAAAIVRFGAGDDPGATPGSRLLDKALERIRVRTSAHTTVALACHDHALVVTTDPDRLPAIAGSVREVLGELAPDASVVVGIGDPVDHLEDVLTSQRHALDAAEVAARVPSFGGVAAWDALGVYRILIELAADTDALRERLHPALMRLLEADANGTLAHTLETYLDLGGNAKVTAERLVLHRAGLYHRLDRIRSIAGVDLRDGETRLELHLSLRLARLAGLYEGAHSS